MKQSVRYVETSSDHCRRLVYEASSYNK